MRGPRYAAADARSYRCLHVPDDADSGAESESAGAGTSSESVARSLEAFQAVDVATSTTVAPDLVVIEGEYLPLLQQHDVPVIWKGTRFFLAEWTAEMQASAKTLSIPFRI